MDYVELLNQSCPPEVAEYVISASPSHTTATLWPNGDYYGDAYDPNCHFAIIGFYSNGVGTDSSENWDGGFVWQVKRYFQDAPQLIKDDATLALKRLAMAGKELPNSFFYALHENDLDLRKELAVRYPTLPDTGSITADRSTRDYVFYLAHLHEPGAFERIAEAMETIKGPSLMLTFLDQLFQWDTPGREWIFERYKDDGRQTSNVEGNPGLAVADWPRMFLGLPRYTGPRVHMNADGVPIDYATTPAGKSGQRNVIPDR